MSPEQRAVPFWPVMAAIFFGSFLSSLASVSMNIATPVLMEAFHVELDVLQWVLTGFMLAFGAISPIAGYLGERFSYKTVYLVSLAGFVAASAVCALAWNAPSLIAFRVLQGVACALIIPATIQLSTKWCRPSARPWPSVFGP